MTGGLRALCAIFAFLLGCVFFSFGGVVVARLPRGESIVSPGSHCDRCGRMLKWYENIPLVSWLLQRGRCRGCGEKIGVFPFLFELFGGLGFLAAFLRFGLAPETLFAFAVIWLVGVMAGIDWENHFAYDGMQIAYFLLSAGYALFLCLAREGRWSDFVIGGVAGFAVFLLIKGVGRLIARRECMGMGDVLFMGSTGVLVGWKALLFCVLVASVVGAIVELVRERLHARRRGQGRQQGAADGSGAQCAKDIGEESDEKEREVAFLPYLALGAVAAMLFGAPVLAWYLGVLA